jgi:hypothetical protein
VEKGRLSEKQKAAGASAPTAQFLCYRRLQALRPGSLRERGAPLGTVRLIKRDDAAHSQV